ncbi:uncharacterized protein EDB91DRAFT_1165512, partial [Suillus paluster]|uniref:uncharacterized protein n=1 Tax=Suillus paluster TaxID=48578 RepID=UPI001B870B68
MNVPRFAACRLHLPCIAFRVTEVIRNIGRAQGTHFTYGVKANGLHDLLLATKETLNQFTPEKPPLQTFLPVCPWDRRLLELPDFAELPDSGDDTQSADSNYSSAPESPLDESPGGSPVEQKMGDSDSPSRALRLKRGGEYKRIVSDHDIVAQVKDVASTIHNMMDVRII